MLETLGTVAVIALIIIMILVAVVLTVAIGFMFKYAFIIIPTCIVGRVLKNHDKKSK